MSKSEEKFARYLKLTMPDAYVRKIPDYKQTCNAALKGLPDYLVIKNNIHTWYEVKFTNSLKTFNFNSINSYQWIEFKKLLDVGTDVIVVIYNGNYDVHFKFFSHLLLKRLQGDKFITL